MLSKKQVKNILWLLSPCLDESYHTPWRTTLGFYTKYGFKTMDGLIESIQEVVKVKNELTNKYGRNV